MTGGGSLVYGFDKLLREKTGINVHHCGRGGFLCGACTGKALEDLDLLKGNSLTDTAGYSTAQLS
jgi:rod shape-determining protein MreB